MLSTFQLVEKRKKSKKKFSTLNSNISKLGIDFSKRLYPDDTQTEYNRMYIPTPPGGLGKSSQQFKCDFNNCNEIFKTKQELITHKYIHSNDKKFICDFNDCNKTFKQKSNLFNHKKYIHLNERKFICNFDNCNKKFRNNSKLNRHKRCVHLNKRPFKCDFKECFKRFNEKSVLKRHKYIHL